MTVVDASVVFSVLVRGEHADWADEHLSAAGGGRSLWVPHLIDVEVGHALRRTVAARKLGEDRAVAALGKLSVETAFFSTRGVRKTSRSSRRFNFSSVLKSQPSTGMLLNHGTPFMLSLVVSR